MLTAVPGGPLASLVDHSVVLDFADEQSIVQTRFPTTSMTWLRRASATIRRRRRGLRGGPRGVPPGRPVGVRALRLPRRRLDGGPGPRGGAQDAGVGAGLGRVVSRHGLPPRPDRGRGPRSLVWMFGTPPPGLREQVESTGARVVTSDLDPLAQLVQAQRLAVSAAAATRARPGPPASAHPIGGARAMRRVGVLAGVAAPGADDVLVSGAPAQAHEAARAAQRVFVSPAGHAGATGTRQDPLASVNEAVATALARRRGAAARRHLCPAHRAPEGARHHGPPVPPRAGDPGRRPPHAITRPLGDGHDREQHPGGRARAGHPGIRHHVEGVGADRDLRARRVVTRLPRRATTCTRWATTTAPWAASTSTPTASRCTATAPATRSPTCGSATTRSTISPSARVSPSWSTATCATGGSRTTGSTTTTTSASTRSASSRPSAARLATAAPTVRATASSPTT